MKTAPSFAFIASAALPVVLAGSSGSASVTPHESYSSSVGVLGCKINTNRVAYWPESVDCNNICVKLSYGGRSVHLLRIDQSEGAHDVSYDAWNYLSTGNSAAQDPTTGGGIAMDYEYVDAGECADLILTDDGKLPLSASNSMNYLASCLDQPSSWVAKNYQLWNVLDPVCQWGCDEKCTLDWPNANQADCPSGLGTAKVLTDTPVYNIQYGSGKTVLASSGEVVNNAAASSGSSVNFSSGGVKITLPGGGSKAAESNEAEAGPEAAQSSSAESTDPTETPAASESVVSATPSGFTTLPASSSAAAAVPTSSGSRSGSGSGSATPSGTGVAVPSASGSGSTAASDSSPSSSGTPGTVQSAGRKQVTIPFAVLLPILTVAFLG
ncbi:hypothetical protein jhhlp_002111 [Lomentospora prolificans]|uniref:Uncharacterized protein n=1 Tax=Lomentospora prolificans TaxID=41688 RepID=A0A2N3ND44_9PEZI|nr:hypothetical protein jhhlp_002111 [Lomentospora prolificans]